MLMYIISIYMIILVISNFVFSKILYKEPAVEEFFCNVKNVSIKKDRYFFPEPKYVLGISILVGLVIGFYLALSKYAGVNSYFSFIVVAFVTFFYLFDMTRGIRLNEEKMILQHGCGIKKTIPVEDIRGLFVFTYNKKFLKQYALTTKLVITTKDNKRYVYTISSLNYKKVINMMKENFGVVSHKMFVRKQDKQPEIQE